MLGFPAITLRDSIERPEALDTGGIITTGVDPSNVVEAIECVLADRHSSARVPSTLPADYTVPDTSRRVVNFILSTWRRQNQWAGIRP